MPSIITAMPMYTKLTTKQNVPPKPETILLGLSSLRSGYITPMPIARPFRARAITEMPPQKKTFWAVGKSSMLLESQMSGMEIASEMLVASMNFTPTTRFKPSGERPTIQRRLPSSENCG